MSFLQRSPSPKRAVIEMNKLILITTIFALLGISAAGQSGRRAQPTPAPVSSGAAHSASDTGDSDFSESKPTSGPSYSRKRPQQNSAPVQPKADTTESAGSDDVIKV